MRQLVIDRSWWLRGDPETSCLLDDRGMRCCLGFYLQACGLPDESMHQVGSPDGIYPPSIPQDARWLVCNSTSDDEDGPVIMQTLGCGELITANDKPTRGRQAEEQRESEIARLFATYAGVEVVFVDETPTPTGSEGES